MAEQGRPASARTTRVVSTLFALTLALLGPVVMAPAASAHATVAASWPANGQVIPAAPDHVVVEFTTAVSPDAVIAVVDPQGISVAVGEPRIDGRFLTQRIEPTGRSGMYVAGIHVIAQDLHPIVTRLEFTVDPAAAATTNPAGAEPGLPPARAAGAPVATPSNHLRTVFPGMMIVALAGLVALALRRQSRTHPV